MSGEQRVQQVLRRAARDIRMTAVGLATLAMACGKSEPPPPATGAASEAPVAATPAPGQEACPQTGLWAECSVIYRLERAGLLPRVDSTAKPAEPSLTGRVLMLKIGLSAQLELHLYADSTARIAESAKLDHSAFVSSAAPQSVKRERTLIESANVIGLLTSINAHQRERVSDALTAGPPQPQRAQTMNPVVSGK